MRRTIVLTAATAALALTALTGCKDDSAATVAAGAAASPSSVTAPTTAAPIGAPTSTSPTSPVPGAFDPEQALAAKPVPYSAVMSVANEVAGTPSFTTKGRVNTSAPMTGQMVLRSADAPGEQAAVHTEVVLAEDFAYSRDLTKPGSGWVKVPRSGQDRADYVKYAALLLATGPSARKGMEDVAGTPVYHLAGRLEVEQIASIDPQVYRSMKGKITTFDCDQWIDSQGRTLRFEQRMTIRGQATVNKITFTEFGGPVTVTAPANDEPATGS
ncbi:hypothetical protein ACFVVX_36185 [Kitasatospora sp. NPDC058170]|uniref:hypothetical protein n=1 Tax=Kitasatospora sp. NPDC058170 TaxID=3346364 RepID=UPI0036DDB4B0